MRIKSLFISDVHLGNPNSQPDKLLENNASNERRRRDKTILQAA